MSDSYKHSYIVGENLLNSLSVYNVGYQKCDPEYQWGPGVRAVSYTHLTLPTT